MQLFNKTRGKSTLLGAAGLAAVLLLSPAAQAGARHGSHSDTGNAAQRRHSTVTKFTDYARVIHSEPVYRRIKQQQPTQHCWQEEPEYTTRYHHRDKRSRREHSGQAIVGGIVGGVIGNQLGRHAGGHKARIGATVAGAIVGSALANEGHRRDRRHGWQRPSHSVTESRPDRHCTEVYETQYKRKLVGYNVTYRYRGRTLTTYMRRDPGHRIPVQVSISPRG